MSLEYRAVRDLLSVGSRVRHPEGTIFEVGTVPGIPWRVALALTGQGNNQAAVVAERAGAFFNPRAMLVVGVAGGLKDDIALGDVVVATWVYGYHGGKQDAAGFQARPRAWSGSHELEQAARLAETNGSWTVGLPRPAEPAVHFKPIAAGEVVLNSPDAALVHQLKQHYGDAVAVETESAGAATAAHFRTSLPVLTIRGISDKADGTKGLSDAAGLQPIAASHAAAFAIALLRELAAASAGSTASPMAESGIAWRPLPQALETMWLPQLGVPRATGAAILELHLVPATPNVPLEARRLAAVNESLAAAGQESSPLGPVKDAPSGDQAPVRGPARAGVLITAHGQRSAWQPLPKDSIGAILDPEDVLGRLTVMLEAVLGIQAPSPAEAGVALGITPFIMVSEGLVADLPRTVSRMRTSMSLIRVPAGDVLEVGTLAASQRVIAAELTERLFLAFRSRAA